MVVFEKGLILAGLIFAGMKAAAKQLRATIAFPHSKPNLHRIDSLL
jgi:hypothetical protein